MRGMGMAAVSLIMAGLGLATATPVAAQKDERAEACLHATLSRPCEMNRDELDTLYRQREWDANVKREQDYAAQRAQRRATARAEANDGRISRAQAIMHRRHVAAAEAQTN